MKHSQLVSKILSYIELDSELDHFDKSIAEGNYLLKNVIDPKTKTITLVYGGISLTEDQKNLIREKAVACSLEDAKIEFKQRFSFDQITKKILNLRTLHLKQTG